MRSSEASARPIRTCKRGLGFTYIGLLIVVAIAGIALAGAGELWSVQSKRERELDLLFAGDQMRRAIESYRAASPGGAQFPRALEELLEDKRFPSVRRHLRRVFIDPMTGRPEWGLVKAGDRIVGVYSLSEDEPVKRSNFSARDQNFAAAKQYRDWRFVVEQSARAPKVGVVGAPQGKAAPPGSESSALRGVPPATPQTTAVPRPGM